MSRVQRQKLKWGLVFISPWLAGFIILTLYPMGASLYYSFTDYDVLRPPVWVGVQNYTVFLTQDNLAFTAISNTLFYAVFSVPLGIVVAVALALLLNARVKGLAVFRSIFFIPSIVPVVASAVLWVWLFSTRNGLINLGLQAVGLPKVAWLSDPAWTKPALIIMSLWSVGGSVVIYLAGLQDIPQPLYEAAMIDGANTWQQITRITLPLLTPQIFFQLVLGLIGAFQVFVQAFILGAIGGGALGMGSEAGPANSLLFYSLYLYLNAFRFFRMGYASAMAWLLFLITLALTLVVLRSSRQWVHYGGA
ncbi:MAG: sugar ABC transporter permease [Anaerolineae bacterium]|nr:sugar ABC transporter permease [Thermoflexales bacterium]MDW8408562.1 sugar ABC transporter permease [Anaerolineae bacterium]